MCELSARATALCRHVARSTHTNYTLNQTQFKKLASIKLATETKLLFKVITTTAAESVVLITKEIELLLLYWGVASRLALSLRQLLKIQEAFCCCGGFYSRFARQWIPVMSVGILTRDETSAGVSWQSLKRANIAHVSEDASDGVNTDLLNADTDNVSARWQRLRSDIECVC